MLPTHFYVAFNDSELKKDVIEKFTFDLCHYYFNYAGPIEVPAPCMYAHKIAKFFMNSGLAKEDLKEGAMNVSERLFDSLHFLWEGGVTHLQFDDPANY